MSNGISEQALGLSDDPLMRYSTLYKHNGKTFTILAALIWNIDIDKETIPVNENIGNKLVDEGHHF